MSSIVREPTIYDVVAIETDDRCQRYHGEKPVQCTNTATHVFVYEASLNPEDDNRRNCLSCEQHTPRETPDRFRP